MGGKESCVNEAKTRANRVRRFLKQQGIDSRRIRIADAGHLLMADLVVHCSPISAAVNGQVYQ